MDFALNVCSNCIELLRFMTLNVTLIGPGAVGSFFAAKLADSVCLTLVGRKGSHFSHIEKEGIQLETDQGLINVAPSKFRCLTQLDTLKPKSQDVLFISLKDYALTPDLARCATRIAADDAVVVFVQNGLPEHCFQDVSATELGKIFSLHFCCSIFPVIACHTESSAGVRRVKISRPLNKISVSFPLETENNPRIKELCALFNTLGIASIFSEKSQKELTLEKFQFFLAINTLSVLFDKPLGDIFYGEEFQEIIRFLVLFVNDVAQKMGIRLRNYENFKSIPITKTHYSSMHTDFAKGQLMEIASIRKMAQLARTLGAAPSKLHKIEEMYRIFERFQHNRNRKEAQDAFLRLFPVSEVSRDPMVQSTINGRIDVNYSSFRL